MYKQDRTNEEIQELQYPWATEKIYVTCERSAALEYRYKVYCDWNFNYSWSACSPFARLSKKNLDREHLRYNKWKIHREICALNNFHCQNDSLHDEIEKISDEIHGRNKIIELPMKMKEEIKIEIPIEIEVEDTVDEDESVEEVYDLSDFGLTKEEEQEMELRKNKINHNINEDNNKQIYDDGLMECGQWSDDEYDSNIPRQFVAPIDDIELKLDNTENSIQEIYSIKKEPNTNKINTNDINMITDEELLELDNIEQEYNKNKIINLPINNTNLNSPISEHNSMNSPSSEPFHLSNSPSDVSSQEYEFNDGGSFLPIPCELNIILPILLIPNTLDTLNTSNTPIVQNTPNTPSTTKSNVNSYQPVKRERRKNCHYEQNKIIGIPYKKTIEQITRKKKQFVKKYTMNADSDSD
jgi:hypothetical protein